MSVQLACERGEEVARQYNETGIVPFPFELILKSETNLQIVYAEDLPENLSGVIIYDKQSLNFLITVNKMKPMHRQYFTIAHELGHYYLHRDILQKEEIIVDDGDLGMNVSLYRQDTGISSEIEREANNFAACLLMPENLVREAWKVLKNIEECANLFKVSSVAMAIRLERLKLVQ